MTAGIAGPEDVLALIAGPPSPQAITRARNSAAALAEEAATVRALALTGSSAALSATREVLADVASDTASVAAALEAATAAIAGYAEAVEAETTWARWACMALVDPIESIRAAWQAVERIDEAAAVASSALLAAVASLPTTPGRAGGAAQGMVGGDALQGWRAVAGTVTGWVSTAAAACVRGAREALADYATAMGRDLIGLGLAWMLADAATSHEVRARLVAVAADLLNGGDNSAAVRTAEELARHYFAAGLGTLAIAQALQPTPRVHPYGSAPGVTHTPQMTFAAHQAVASPPSTVAEAITTMDAVDHAGGEGDDVTTAVAVERLDFVDEDGTVLETRWIVTLPSTQEGAAGLLAPSWADAGALGDWESDAASRWNSATGSSLTTAYERAVLDAMEAAGIGAGEPVMLAGFSQGGMIAADIARSDAHDFQIDAVFAVGSPIDDPPVPPGIATVQLAHTDDSLVPQVDGVYRAPPTDTAVSIVTGTGGHDAGEYVATAESLTGPEADRAAALLAGFVGVEASAVDGAVAIQSHGAVYEFRE